MDDELDYDNIIVQNILIRKGLEDDEEYHDLDLDEDEPVVEIHQKAATQTQKLPSAESPNNVNSYLVTTLGSTELELPGEYIDDTSDSGSSSSGDDSEEYNVIQREVVDLDGDFEIDESSDDSEWEKSVHRASAAAATKKGAVFACELCEKKCNTKRGLDMHKRAHERRKEKGYE